MAGPFVQFGLVAADVQDLQRGERLPQQVFGVEVFLDLRSSGSKAKLLGAIAFEQQNTARPQRSDEARKHAGAQSWIRELADDRNDGIDLSICPAIVLYFNDRMCVVEGLCA